MWYVIIFIIITILLIFLWARIYFIRRKQQILVLTVNEMARKKFKEENFVVEKYIYLNDSNTANCSNFEKKFIALNITQRKIGLIDYENSKVLVTKFCDVLDFEVYENNVNFLIGREIGDEIIDIRQEVNCKDLKLIITLKNYENSSVIYNLVCKTDVAKDSSLYKKIIFSLQNCISFLKIIKEENNKTENKKD